MNEAQWFYADANGAQQGPLSTADLRNAVASGRFHAGVLVWREGMAEWMPVGSVAELQAAPAAPRVGVAPSAPAAPAANKSVIDLKQTINLPTGKFVLLTIATFGFYAYHWILKNSPLLRDASGKPMPSDAYIIALVALASWGGVFAGVDDYRAASVVMCGGLMTLAAWIMLVLWAFKAKDALRAYAASTIGIDYHMNAFYTFLFGYFYINYCINEIPEEQARLRSFAQRAAA